MPRDVALGEGYIGSEMVSTVTPGQHRGEFSVETGRSVLVRHGFTYSEDGRVVRTEDDIDDNWRDGEGEGLGEAKSFALGRMESAAQLAVAEAVDRARRGIIKNVAQANEHIRLTLCSILRDYMKELCETLNAVYRSAVEKARPLVEKAIEEYGKKGISGLDEWVPEEKLGLGNVGVVLRGARKWKHRYDGDVKREAAHIAGVLAHVASEAAADALRAAGKQFKSLGEAEAFIRGCVMQIAALFPPAIHKAALEAVSVAVGGIRAEFEKKLASFERVPKAVVPLYEDRRDEKEAKEGGVGQFIGPGQQFYVAVTNAQNKAIAIQAEISGIGKDDWNKVQRENRAAFEAQGWKPVENYSYDNMMSFWLAQFKRVVITPTKMPSEADVKDVMRLAAGTDKMIALVKSLSPSAVAARAEADRREMEERLAKMGPIKSPADVARETLVHELKERAKGFIVSPVGIGILAAISLGLYLALRRGN